MRIGNSVKGKLEKQEHYASETVSRHVDKYRKKLKEAQLLIVFALTMSSSPSPCRLHILGGSGCGEEDFLRLHDVLGGGVFLDSAWSPW